MIRIDTNAGNVALVFSKLAVNLADLQKPLNQVGLNLKQLVYDGFRGEVDPWGQAWKPLAAKTLANRAGRGIESTAILFATGQLYASLDYALTSFELVLFIGTPERPAPPHQFGTGRIPARPMFPQRSPDTVDLPEKWEDAIINPIADHLRAAFR